MANYKPNFGLRLIPQQHSVFFAQKLIVSYSEYINIRQSNRIYKTLFCEGIVRNGLL